MPSALDSTAVAAVLDRLSIANAAFRADYPGEPTTRQPVHTVYGGAQLYRAETPQKLGEIARRYMAEYGHDWVAFARALALPGSDALPEGNATSDWARTVAADPEGARGTHPEQWLAWAVHQRTLAKLEQEPVEDFRIDFEDGFGNRPDAEEDAAAERTAREVARAMDTGLLPPFIGIRIKTFSEELKARSARTLDLFVSTLVTETGGVLPENFVITLPKVAIPEQVEAFVALLAMLEDAHGLAAGALKMELMIEATQAIIGADGRSVLPSLARAAGGRCTGAHFGTYDYTATANITARHQVMDHEACDFAKHMMMVSYAGSGIFLSDGATNVMPAPPHKGKALSAEQVAENTRVVHDAWRLAYGHIGHSLVNGFYQGWDLHPGQLPIRYAACYAFFLEGLEAASERLSNFIDKAAQATLVGDVFDDAATGQGLLNYFLRALNAGAVTLDEVRATGLTLEEIQGRSFLKILENRRRL